MSLYFGDNITASSKQIGSHKRINIMKDFKLPIVIDLNFLRINITHYRDESKLK